MLRSQQTVTPCHKRGAPGRGAAMKAGPSLQWKARDSMGQSLGSVNSRHERTTRSTVSSWHYAVICIPGLEILGRMHRDMADAVAEQQLLGEAKRQFQGLRARGVPYTAAVMATFGKLSGSSRGADTSFFLRCYGQLPLTKEGFLGRLRSPCYHTIEEALAARNRLLRALYGCSLQGGSECDTSSATFLRQLSHTECVAALERLGEVHLALLAERPASSARGPKPQEKCYRRLAKAVMQVREATAMASLRRLLQRYARLRQERPAAQRGLKRKSWAA